MECNSSHSSSVGKRIINSGGKVIIWDVDKKAVEIAQKEINSKNFSFQIVDITDFSNVEKSVGDLEEQFGKIDIFVNNAGSVLTTRGDKEGIQLEEIVMKNP